MSKLRTLALSVLTAGALSAFTPTSHAFPGLYVGKKESVGTAHATHMAVMIKGDTTIVSVMPDYEGALEPFALVMPVPGDVTLEKVKTLKREFVDRLEMLTAPRFMEFWEMDPCDPGPLEQEWERSKLASAETAFLGGGQVGGEKKVPKEMLLTVTPDYKEGEYTISVLGKDQAGDLGGFLKGKGYVLSDKASAALKPYLDAGMNLIVAEVDTKRVELVGGERASLSPIRYATQTAVTKIPSKLGLVNLDKKQELFVYVLSPDQRYEAKNYENLFPPTNISVDFAAKERMGELYAALHDRLQEKSPKSFLVEYAWPTEGCGQPCQNEALLPHELLSLGGDVLEELVPEADRNPEPPEQTEEEKKKEEAELKELKPAERPKAKKQLAADRTELARRKALLARQKYVLTRLHHRYDAANLPDDPVIGPAGHVAGGATLPKGEKMEISTEIKSAEASKLQTRFNTFHPWKGMMKCEKPERWRWGKPPREYRGLRKTWVAADLTRKNRTQVDPAKLVQTPVPSLGLTGAPPPGAEDAGADAGAAAPAAKKSCGCSVPGAPVAGRGLALSLGLLGLIALARRRRD
jgi:MYXO-CTERM domain-containing protein